MSEIVRPHSQRKKRTKAVRDRERMARVESRSTPMCDAPTAAGGRCKRPAGHGTGHVGTGRCRAHGGNSDTHNVAATVREAAVMGSPLNITPMDAILWCVQISAGEVAYASAQVAALESAITRQKSWKDRPLSHGKDGEDPDTMVRETTVSEQRMNIWVTVRHKAMDNLAKYSKLALDAGIAERQVRMSEQTGEGIARMLEGILTDLALTPEQQAEAPAIVRKHLTMATTGRKDSLLPPIPAALESGTMAGGLFDVEGTVAA